MLCDHPSCKAVIAKILVKAMDKMDPKDTNIRSLHVSMMAVIFDEIVEPWIREHLKSEAVGVSDITKLSALLLSTAFNCELELASLLAECKREQDDKGMTIQ